MVAVGVYSPRYRRRLNTTRPRLAPFLALPRPAG